MSWNQELIVFCIDVRNRYQSDDRFSFANANFRHAKPLVETIEFIREITPDLTITEPRRFPGYSPDHFIEYDPAKSRMGIPWLTTFVKTYPRFSKAENGQIVENVGEIDTWVSLELKIPLLNSERHQEFTDIYSLDFYGDAQGDSGEAQIHHSVFVLALAQTGYEGTQIGSSVITPERASKLIQMIKNNLR